MAVTTGGRKSGKTEALIRAIRRRAAAGEFSVSYAEEEIGRIRSGRPSVPVAVTGQPGLFSVPSRTSKESKH